jgi:phage-related protein (TIGR01555 family)
MADLNGNGVLTNEDSLRDVYRAMTPVGNSHLGLGNERDSTQYADIQHVRQLSDIEKIALYEGDSDCQKVATLLPAAAKSAGIVWTFGQAKRAKPHLVGEYLENLRTGSFLEALAEASIEARVHGNAYLLLGIDDGGEFDEPVREQRIRSLRWVEPLFEGELEPIVTRGDYRKPEFYQLSAWRNLGEDGDVQRLRRVHRSRVIHLAGVKRTGLALYYASGKHLSVYQAMLNSLVMNLQVYSGASNMVLKSDLFWYKMRGLASLATQNDNTPLLKRMLTIQMGMSVVKGLTMDADNEDAGFISRNFGGVKDIIQILEDKLISDTGIPRSKLRGTSSRTGLGAEGRGIQDRFEWASCVDDYRENHWREPIHYVSKLVLLAKDGPTKGRLPDGWGFNFPSVLQLTPFEILEMRKLKAETDKINIDAGKLTGYEARMSEFGAPEWSYEITLDPQISELKREQALNLPDPMELQQQQQQQPGPKAEEEDQESESED